MSDKSVSATEVPPIPATRTDPIAMPRLEKSDIALLAVLAVAALAAPFVGGFYLYVLTLAGIYAIVTIGNNLLLSHGGLLSLGQGGLVAISCYVCAYMGNAGMPFPIVLLAGAWFLSPGLAPRPLIAAAPAPLSGSEWDEARAQSIAPIAWGATTGRHVAAGDLVAPLAETPERPTVTLTATLGTGDDLESVLERAGVSNDDADTAAALVSRRMALGDLKPGTRLDLTLGRRASKSVPRPLEKLAFRARFDLELAVARSDGKLTLTPKPIAIDHTPLRIEGLVVGQCERRCVQRARDGAPAFHRAADRHRRRCLRRVREVVGNAVARGEACGLGVARAAHQARRRAVAGRDLQVVVAVPQEDRAHGPVAVEGALPETRERRGPAVAAAAAGNRGDRGEEGGATEGKTSGNRMGHGEQL